MNTNIQNPYIRLQHYYLWLTNDYKTTNLDDNYDFGIPMLRIHEITDIPIEIIRKDFVCLFQWHQSLYLSILADENCESYTSN